MDSFYSIHELDSGKRVMILKDESFFGWIDLSYEGDYRFIVTFLENMPEPEMMTALGLYLLVSMTHIPCGVMAAA